MYKTSALFPVLFLWPQQIHKIYCAFCQDGKSLSWYKWTFREGQGWTAKRILKDIASKTFSSLNEKLHHCSFFSRTKEPNKRRTACRHNFKMSFTFWKINYAASSQAGKRIILKIKHKHQRKTKQSTYLKRDLCGSSLSASAINAMIELDSACMTWRKEDCNSVHIQVGIQRGCQSEGLAHTLLGRVILKRATRGKSVNWRSLKCSKSLEFFPRKRGDEI